MGSLDLLLLKKSHAMEINMRVGNIFTLSFKLYFNLFHIFNFIKLIIWYFSRTTLLDRFIV